jgi:hypothetical protein
MDFKGFAFDGVPGAKPLALLSSPDHPGLILASERRRP